MAAAGLVTWQAIAQPGDEKPASPPASKEAAGSAAQPESPASARPRDQARGGEAAFRARLVNRIEDARLQIERAEAALDALDRGEPLQKVSSEYASDGRQGPLLRQDRERIRAFIQEHMPRLWERLAPIERGSPQRADRLLISMRPRVLELIALKRRTPKLFEFKLEETRSDMLATEAARELRELRARRAPADEIAEKEAGIRALVSQSVDAQLKFKAAEIEMLGQRLDRLRKGIDAQTGDREKIIEQRTRRLINPGQEGGPGRGGEGRTRAGGRHGDAPPSSPPR